MGRGTPYLCCNVLPLHLRNRIPQSNGRGVYKVTLAVGHSQMDSTVGPGLHVDVPISGLHFGLDFKSKRMSRIVGQHALRQSGSLQPFEVFELVMDFWMRQVSSIAPIPHVLRRILR